MKITDVTVIGDVHGCFKTAQALVAKIKKKHPNTTICFVGDLIDRGPNSKDLVQWVMDNDFDCVQGNHEQMMVDWNGTMSDHLWLGNGGDITLESYYDHLGGDFDAETFMSHQMWMNDLPTVLHYKDCKTPEGRELVVSHSICHNYWKALNGDDEYRAEKACVNITWGRSFANVKDQGFYNVIGHTPQYHGPRITKVYANIDTGCFIGFGGWKEFETPKNGRLTALHVNTMEIIDQKLVD